MIRYSWALFLLLLFPWRSSTPEVVSFPSGNLTLHGVLYKPQGTGPFPAIVYNHGSAPGMLSSKAFEVLGPMFAGRGWVFFAPYRRGQGLSVSAGPYIGDQIAPPAKKKGGIPAGAATMIRLLETDHVNDQLAALAWLRKQGFVQREGHRLDVPPDLLPGAESLYSKATNRAWKNSNVKEIHKEVNTLKHTADGVYEGRNTLFEQAILALGERSLRNSARARLEFSVGERD